MPETPLNSDDQPEVPLDEAGRIIGEITCRGCGYNLRGLLPDGVCPECAIAVGRSIKGDLLQYCDPAWVDRLGRGMTWVIWGTIAEICLGIAVAVLMGVLSAGGATRLSPAIAIAAAAALAAVLVTVIGVWLVTTPEAGSEEREPVFSIRQMARWGVTVGIISGPLQFSWNRGGVAVGANMSPMTTFLAVLAFILAGVVLAGHAACFIYLRRLALRLPNDSLAWQTRTVMWGYVAAQAMALATGILTIMVVPNMMNAANPGPMVLALLLGSCAFLLGILIFGIWALVLLFKYQAAFRRAAAQARATWAAPVGDINAGVEVDFSKIM